MSEAVIVGGGLAGASAAILLARAGQRAHLVEREREPADKICGEFLSIEAQRALAHVGVELDQLGASRIAVLRLALGADTIEVPLPFVARGLTRKRLDATLLDLAGRAGARIDRGVTVRSIGPERIDTTAGQLSTNLLLLASGKHEVRCAARDATGCDTGHVGFKTYWRLPSAARTALDGRIDVILFDGGYAGLQLVEGGIANLCLLVTKPRLAALGGTWEGVRDMLLREPAAAALRDAEQVSARPITIAGVPYGFLVSPRHAHGFRLGDQAAVIPSFCGEGMAIALQSAAGAARVIAGGGSAAHHHAVLRRQLAPRIRLATGLQRAAARSMPRRLIWTALRLRPDLIAWLVHHTRVPSGSFGEC